MAKKEAGMVVDLPEFVQNVSIDGHAFKMQVDDVAMLRKVLDAAQMGRELDAGADGSSQVDALVALGTAMKEAVDLAFGDGAHDTLFGAGRLPVARQLALISALEGIAAPAYDDMMEKYKAAQ